MRGGAARQHGVTLLGVGLVEGEVGRRLAQREAEGVGRPHVQQLARDVGEAHGVVHAGAEHIDGALLEGLAVGLHGLVQHAARVPRVVLGAPHGRGRALHELVHGRCDAMQVAPQPDVRA